MAGFKLPKSLLKAFFPSSSSKKKSSHQRHPSSSSSSSGHHAGLGSSQRRSGGRGGGNTPRGYDELSPILHSGSGSSSAGGSPFRTSSKQSSDLTGSSGNGNGNNAALGSSPDSNGRYDNFLQLCIDHKDPCVSPGTVATTLASSSTASSPEDAGNGVLQPAAGRLARDDDLFGFGSEVATNDNDDFVPCRRSASGDKVLAARTADSADVDEDKERSALDANVALVEPPSASTDSTTVPTTPKAGAADKQQLPSSPYQSQPTKRVQFSVRGEEAHRRAIARQKRILSNASQRLGAISDTSLENIADATTAAASNAPLHSGRDCSGDDNNNGEEDESLDDLPSASASEVGVHDEDGSKSVKSVVSHQVLGEGEGNVSSIVFYESSTPVKEQTTSEVQERLDEQEKKLSDLAHREDKEKAAEVAKTYLTPAGVAETNAAQGMENAAAVIEETKKEEETMQFFILLLCPTSRIFELVEISDARPESTVGDVVDVIPEQCTDERLLGKKYVGFVRPYDRMEFVELESRAFQSANEQTRQDEKKSDHDSWGEKDDWPSSLDVIREDDVLVAILEGYSGYEMSKISKPILRNNKFREMIRRRSRRGGGKGRSSKRRDASDNCSVKSFRSSKSRSSRRSSRRKSGSVSSKSRRSSRRHSRSTPVPIMEIDTSILSDFSIGKNKGIRSKVVSPDNNEGKEKYSTLCQKLEHLSKKLHDVDDEIVGCDASVTGAKPRSAVPSAASTNKEDKELAADEANAPNSHAEVNNEEEMANVDMEIPAASSFKMTPNMLAYELAANIEDIFADHDVEIVAVDADAVLEPGQGDSDDDDDTFVSARSRRSIKSARSFRDLVRGFQSGQGVNDRRIADRGGVVREDISPVLEITTKPRSKKRRERKKRESKFDTFGEDDMMLQIEAMARQADAAFESRKSMDSSGRRIAGTAIIEPGIGAIEEDKTDNGKKSAAEDEDADADKCSEEAGEASSLPSIDADEEGEMDDVLGALNSESVESMFEGETAISITSAATQDDDTLSRNFLNTSTSMVSTMVAASKGRINEVHVLQYLGVTIVCIAANLVQQSKRRSPGTPGKGGMPFGANEVFQSAMFLAFMVNGQRYMAKVTKKET